MEILLPEAKRRKVTSQAVSVASSVVDYNIGRDDQSGHVDSESSDGQTRKTAAVLHVVTPGEIIARNDAGFMRGHGTFVDDNNLVSSVAGVVERVNRLISVRPLKSRFTGEIGDVVVCRILDISQKRWKVDTNSRQDSVLMLSAVNLPGGVQRRKQDSDELQMRSFFAEGDVLSAEVQAFFGDGSMAIHTRSLKYGKLMNGTFLSVPPALIKRCKSHFHVLPCGVEVILGLNGYIWVSQPAPERKAEDDEPKPEPVNLGMRETIARVCNTILALRHKFMFIYDTSIIYCYEASLTYSIKDMLRPDVIDHITDETKSKLDLLQ